MEIGMGWAQSGFFRFLVYGYMLIPFCPSGRKTKIAFWLLPHQLNLFRSDSDSRKQLKHRLHSRVIPCFQLSFLFSFFLRQNVSRHSNHASWKTGSSDLRKESLTSDSLRVQQRLKSCYAVELPDVFRTQGHPMTVSSHIHWKDFLGYPEYF